MNQMENNKKNIKNNKNNNNSSYSLVFGRWPQTKIAQAGDQFGISHIFSPRQRLIPLLRPLQRPRLLVQLVSDRNHEAVLRY